MTCAHVVDVSLRKVDGVESVEVSLNKGLAVVKLKPGNKVTVQQLWSLIHEKGYTPKETAVSVRGELAGPAGRMLLKVSGNSQILELAAEPRNSSAYSEASRKLGQTVIVDGRMTPAKDLKSPVPLQLAQVK